MIEQVSIDWSSILRSQLFNVMSTEIHRERDQNFVGVDSFQVLTIGERTLYGYFGRFF